MWAAEGGGPYKGMANIKGCRGRPLGRPARGNPFFDGLTKKPPMGGFLVPLCV